MDTTPRLLLQKPNPDPVTGDFVDVAVLNANADKIDGAISFTYAASAALPGAPFAGQGILESDTGKVRVWGGSAYKQILASGAAFDSNIGVGTAPDANALRKFHVFSSGTLGPLSQVLLRQSGAATGSRALSTMGGTDTQDRWWVDFDGNMQWGPGTAGGDVTLFRGAVGRLQTTGVFSANSFAVNGNTARVMTDFQEATCSSLFNLDNTMRDVPGMTVTVTTRKANALCEVMWTNDMDLYVTGGTGMVAISILNFDGADRAVDIVWEPGNVSSARATVGQVESFTIPTAGTHTIKVRGSQVTPVGGPYGIRINNAHSKIIAKIYE